MGAAFHLGFGEEDTIRSTTFGGAMSLNMDFYLRDSGIDMNLEGYFFYQELMFRIAQSDFFVGGNYLYADLDSKRNEGGLSELDPLFDRDFKMGGLAAIVQYDTRDSVFTPSEGLFAKATLRRFDEKLGGTENFWRYGVKSFYFYPLDPSFILGLRVEGEAVHASGNDVVPFFANPSIDMRYQGEKMAFAELQLRWEFINRWNLVLFGGAGKVFAKETIFDQAAGPVEKDTSFKDASTHPAGGVGFRYELARKFGLWGGLDFAKSEDEDFAFYITVGSAWGAF